MLPPGDEVGKGSDWVGRTSMKGLAQRGAAQKCIV